jgi:hypothetical protein
MLRKTQSSSRIHGVVLILIIGFIGTLAALAEQDTKESDLQIPLRRQDETAAAYNRRVSVARNAAARSRALTAQDAKASEIQIPPRRQDETTAAYNRRVSVARNAAAARRAATVRAGTSPQQDAGQDKVYLDAELTIPPKRSNETTAAYNRRVSVARNAAAARRAATVRAGTSPQQDAGQDKVYLGADKRANSILTGGTDQQGGPMNPMMRGQGQGRRMRRMQQGQNQGPGMGPMMGGPGQGRGMGRMMGGPGRGRGMGRMMGGPGQGCMPGQSTCCGCQCCQK